MFLLTPAARLLFPFFQPRLSTRSKTYVVISYLDVNHGDLFRYAVGLGTDNASAMCAMTGKIGRIAFRANAEALECSLRKGK